MTKGWSYGPYPRTLEYRLLLIPDAYSQDVHDFMATSYLWVCQEQSRDRNLILYLFLIILYFHSITIGYHRLWSHRAFTASLPLRIVLAGMGCLGFQGSIK